MMLNVLISLFGCHWLLYLQIIQTRAATLTQLMTSCKLDLLSINYELDMTMMCLMA